MRIAISGVVIFWAFLFAAILRNNAATVMLFTALMLLMAVAFADGRQLWRK